MLSHNVSTFTNGLLHVYDLDYFEGIIDHTQQTHISIGDIIIMAEISVSWVSIQIFIGHSDGIFARFNGNVDGIK